MRYSAEDGKPIPFLGPDWAVTEKLYMGASTRENTQVEDTPCCGENRHSARRVPDLGDLRRVDLSKPQGLAGLNAKATIHFTQREVATILAEFLNSRGLKNVSANQVTFRVHQGSNDPREPNSPGLSGADVEITL